MHAVDTTVDDRCSRTILVFKFSQHKISFNDTLPDAGPEISVEGGTAIYLHATPGVSPQLLPWTNPQDPSCVIAPR
jgi:hypothetical protein